MRPILLSGHERSLTQVKFNADGDILFSCSKDHVINAWWADNGERLGTYAGHNGTVWTVDVDSTSTLLVSGSADNQLRLWSVRTGECLHTWEFPTAVKRVAFSEDDTRILAVTEQRMGHKGTIRVFTLATDGAPQPTEPSLMITPYGSKATMAAWSAMDRFIVSGHEDGSVCLFDAEYGEEYDKVASHSGVITDLQMSPDRTWLVTSSKDKTAKAMTVDGLQHLKTFTAECPLNSAAILPGKPYVLCGGGQEAMSVTTTSARQGHFEVRVWHRIFEEELGRIKAGFGPCNTIAIHPAGTGYAIGGEDGYVRLHHFDAEFFKSRPFGPIEDEIED